MLLVTERENAGVQKEMMPVGPSDKAGSDSEPLAVSFLPLTTDFVLWLYLKCQNKLRG